LAAAQSTIDKMQKSVQTESRRDSAAEPVMITTKQLRIATFGFGLT